MANDDIGSLLKQLNERMHEKEKVKLEMKKRNLEMSDSSDNDTENIEDVHIPGVTASWVLRENDPSQNPRPNGLQVSTFPKKGNIQQKISEGRVLYDQLHKYATTGTSSTTASVRISEDIKEDEDEPKDEEEHKDYALPTQQINRFNECDQEISEADYRSHIDQDTFVTDVTETIEEINQDEDQHSMEMDELSSKVADMTSIKDSTEVTEILDFITDNFSKESPQADHRPTDEDFDGANNDTDHVQLTSDMAVDSCCDTRKLDENMSNASDFDTNLEITQPKEPATNEHVISENICSPEQIDETPCTDEPIPQHGPEQEHHDNKHNLYDLAAAQFHEVAISTVLETDVPDITQIIKFIEDLLDKPFEEVTNLDLIRLSNHLAALKDDCTSSCRNAVFKWLSCNKGVFSSLEVGQVVFVFATYSNTTDYEHLISLLVYFMKHVSNEKELRFVLWGLINITAHPSDCYLDLRDRHRAVVTDLLELLQKHHTSIFVEAIMVLQNIDVVYTELGLLNNFVKIRTKAMLLCNNEKLITLALQTVILYSRTLSGQRCIHNLDLVANVTQIIDELGEKTDPSTLKILDVAYKTIVIVALNMPECDLTEVIKISLKRVFSKSLALHLRISACNCLFGLAKRSFSRIETALNHSATDNLLFCLSEVREEAFINSCILLLHIMTEFNDNARHQVANHDSFFPCLEEIINRESMDLKIVYNALALINNLEPTQQVEAVTRKIAKLLCKTMKRKELHKNDKIMAICVWSMASVLQRREGMQKAIIADGYLAVITSFCSETSFKKIIPEIASICYLILSRRSICDESEKKMLIDIIERLVIMNKDDVQVVPAIDALYISHQTALQIGYKDRATDLLIEILNTDNCRNVISSSLNVLSNFLMNPNDDIKQRLLSNAILTKVQNLIQDEDIQVFESAFCFLNNLTLDMTMVTREASLQEKIEGAIMQLLETSYQRKLFNVITGTLHIIKDFLLNNMLKSNVNESKLMRLCKEMIMDNSCEPLMLNEVVVLLLNWAIGCNSIKVTFIKEGLLALITNRAVLPKYILIFGNVCSLFANMMISGTVSTQEKCNIFKKMVTIGKAHMRYFSPQLVLTYMTWLGTMTLRVKDIHLECICYDKYVSHLHDFLYRPSLDQLSRVAIQLNLMFCVVPDVAIREEAIKDGLISALVDVLKFHHSEDSRLAIATLSNATVDNDSAKAQAIDRGVIDVILRHAKDLCTHSETTKSYIEHVRMMATLIPKFVCAPPCKVKAISGGVLDQLLNFLKFLPTSEEYHKVSNEIVGTLANLMYKNNSVKKQVLHLGILENVMNHFHPNCTGKAHHAFLQNLACSDKETLQTAVKQGIIQHCITLAKQQTEMHFNLAPFMTLLLGPEQIRKQVSEQLESFPPDMRRVILRMSENTTWVGIIEKNVVMEVEHKYEDIVFNEAVSFLKTNEPKMEKTDIDRQKSTLKSPEEIFNIDEIQRGKQIKNIHDLMENNQLNPSIITRDIIRLGA